MIINLHPIDLPRTRSVFAKKVLLGVSNWVNGNETSPDLGCFKHCTLSERAPQPELGCITSLVPNLITTSLVTDKNCCEQMYPRIVANCLDLQNQILIYLNHLSNL